MKSNYKIGLNLIWSISIPNIKEQKKISILLKKIEENIHLQQNKINKLQELKRSFLQNMFI